MKDAAPGITCRAPLSSSESSRASQTDKTGPPSKPQYLKTHKTRSGNWANSNPQYLVLLHYITLFLLHILMPGHERQAIFLLFHISFLLLLAAVFWLVVRDDVVVLWLTTHWIFADESGVEQDDIGPQDRCDHLEKPRVLGETHHPLAVHMNVMKTVRGVVFPCKREPLLLKDNVNMDKWEFQL